MASLDQILAVILGGGRGSRLYPLTQQRSKPAVPIAGKYRLIDIPISNCINSGIYRVAVLTQFNSVSLHRHITRTYNFDAFHQGWVQIWAAEQTLKSGDWYQGTADAVRKQLFEIKAARVPYVLILAGDHLYRMDYAAMARWHWEKEADITVAVQPAPLSEAGRLGILKRDVEGRIVDFAEKPTSPEALQRLVSRSDPQKPYLASMGIYLFRTSLLFEMLENSALEDFGKHVIPAAIHEKAVYGYDFEGYWEDIGTIRSFYETNLALTMPNPPFNLFDQNRPIYTHPRFLPGSVVENSVMVNVLLAEGCCIRTAEVRHSVVGVRSQIRAGAKLVDTVMMGADYYDQTQCEDTLPDGTIPLGIGRNSQIAGAILDKNVRIGANVIIKPFPRDAKDVDGDGWSVREGVVVVPKGAVIKPGTVIEPI